MTRQIRTKFKFKEKLNSVKLYIDICMRGYKKPDLKKWVYSERRSLDRSRFDCDDAKVQIRANYREISRQNGGQSYAMPFSKLLKFPVVFQYFHKFLQFWNIRP